MTTPAREPRAGVAAAVAGAAWLAALLSYLLVGHRFAAVLALDLEALVFNLSQDWAPGYPPPWWARRDWLAAGQAVLTLGAAPLWCLGVAALLQRVAGRWVAPSRLTTAHMSSRLRGGIALLCILPFAAFCLPAGLALSVWVCVEAFVWIQWYGNVDPAMEWIRTWVPLSFPPVALMAGIALARWALPGPKKGRRWLRRLGWGIALLPTAAVLLPLGLVAGLHGSRAAAAPGRGEFVEHCGDCHELGLTLYYVKTPAEWERTMRVQVEVEGVALEPDEREELTAFVLGMRSFPDRWTFRTRCQRCHGLGTRSWDHRTEQEWGRIVDRIARTSPYYYRPDVKAQIVGHLGTAHGTASATVPEGVAELDRVCGACHPVGHAAERIREAGGERAVVRRMSTKMAEPLPLADQDRLTDEYAALLADPEGMARWLPHDTPAADGWIRW